MKHKRVVLGNESELYEQIRMDISDQIWIYACIESYKKLGEELGNQFCTFIERGIKDEA